jgi:RNA polymerase sigma-70 factor (ECF subfamily)
VVITDGGVAQAGAGGPELDALQRDALEDFFRRHYRDLIKITMFVGANEEQAKDAVAGALVAVVRSWDRIDDPLRWATRAAINHFYKEKTRGPERLRSRLMEKGAGTAEGADDHQMSVWEDRQWVNQMLASLTPKQAAVMTLLIQGFTPTEIADLLGRTPEAVRQNLLQARRRLQKAVQQSAPRSTTPASAFSQR